MGIKLTNVNVKKFRRFSDVNFPIGKKLTVISGQNGVGKSNLVSLIASGSGLNRKANFGSNFQPEFYDFFYIDPDEPYSEYELFLTYYQNGQNKNLTKRLSFKDDTKSKRGIRVIPRTSNIEKIFKTQKEAVKAGEDSYGVGGSARIPVPTIYLSMSRLYPLGERKNSVHIKPIDKRNKLYQNEANIKFRQWYNEIIPFSIEPNASLSLVNKNISSRASLHMDMRLTPTLSQSVGQDNIGNIVSALVDVYLLSRQENYKGALICIDEIEVSLHPDTQMHLLGLLEKLADELDIQFIVSTHSLTILKEILKKQERNKEDYSVVYLKNPLAPIVTQQRDYALLKADLLGRTVFDKPRAKVYSEDQTTHHIFSLLCQSLTYQIETHNETKQFRGECSDQRRKLIGQKIEALQDMANINKKFNPIDIELGCEELIKIASKDKTYFDRVIFVLDGDAKIKSPSQKPLARDYLDTSFDGKGLEREKMLNVCYLPNYFAPESYLYRIIYNICQKATDHSVFWRTLDQNEDTALYTPDKLLKQFSNLDRDFKNDDLKLIFDRKETGNTKSLLWSFVDSSRILNYYYGDYSNIEELLEFFENFRKAYEIAYSKTLANRFG